MLCKGTQTLRTKCTTGVALDAGLSSANERRRSFAVRVNNEWFIIVSFLATCHIPPQVGNLTTSDVEVGKAYLLESKVR